MTKYYRRVGTTAFRFNIEAHIQKIELKVPTTNPYPQRLSVIFKRGELRKETKNAPLMEDGVAYFNEKLTVPGILYYDNRKKTFLQKEATLAVNLISKRSTKLMGVTKFDLATFVNNNVTEKDVVLKMEKCSDKNAKFFFKLVINQVKELGSIRKSMKMSIKDSSIRSGSFRGSMKELSFKDSIRESFKEKMEESKASHLQKIDDEVDELYSYYTGSEGSPKRSVRDENEENVLGSPHNIAFDQFRSSTNEQGECNISTLEKSMSEQRKLSEWKQDGVQEEIYNFDVLDTEMPQRCLSPEIKQYKSRTESLFTRKQSTRELEEKMLNYEKDLDIANKALRSKNDDFARLKEDYEKLQQAFNLQSQKFENTKIIKEVSDEDKENIPDIRYCQTKNNDLERKAKQLENQNDSLNKRVQELEKINNEYLIQIQKYIEEKNPSDISTPRNNGGFQYEVIVEEIINRLKEFDQITQNDIDRIEDLMYELINKIKESEQTIHKLKESHRIEKEKSQKDIEILEQGLQRIIREHDQHHYKHPLQGTLASYDHGVYHSQTMSSNSLKTREESIAEEPSIRGVLYDSGEHNSSDFKGSPRIFGAQGNDNIREGSNSDTISLKQEINYLNAKILAMTNIQRQYEEQVKQRHFFQHENKTLKADLEKANKGWAYAEEERYELANKIQEYKETPAHAERAESLEIEVFKLKTKLGEVMNVALEIGGAELLDKIEYIMVQEENFESMINLNKQTFAN